jgi:PPOX class probable F420-dependent enzyme
LPVRPTVPTPVWFALENDKLFVATEPGSGKVKRIRDNPNVQLTACTQRGKLIGPTLKGVAHILPADHRGQVKAALERKYGWMMRVGYVVDWISRTKRDCSLEITPEK